jgi:hypothetical protein
MSTKVQIPSVVQNGFELSGPTANRPDGRNNLPSVTGPNGQGGCIGIYFFDTDIGQPVWWNGTTWVNIAGQPA